MKKMGVGLASLACVGKVEAKPEQKMKLYCHAVGESYIVPYDFKIPNPVKMKNKDFKDYYQNVISLLDEKYGKPSNDNDHFPPGDLNN